MVIWYGLIVINIYSFLVLLKDIFSNKTKERVMFIREQSIGKFGSGYKAIILYNNFEYLCIGNYKVGTYKPGDYIDVYKINNRFYLTSENCIKSVILLGGLLILEILVVLGGLCYGIWFFKKFNITK